MSTLTPQKLRFLSHPEEQRAALVPMSIVMVLSWVLVALAFITACFVIQQSPLYGALILLVLCGFSTYLVFLTYRWLKEARQRHELLIGADSLSLTSYDKEQNIRIKQQIALNEIDSAEHFTARDTASLILRGHTSTVEIPLWAFGPEAELRIIGYLKSRGVKVLGVPNDIVI